MGMLLTAGVAGMLPRTVFADSVDSVEVVVMTECVDEAVDRGRGC